MPFERSGGDLRYRPEIDGLRALAVVPVLLYHAGVSGFSGGYVGVDVFFVISGYLITSIITADLGQGDFSIWTFYERRARRILPALLLVVCACLPFAWFWSMPRDLETFNYSVMAVLTFTSNHFFWRNTGYFDTTADLQPLLHTWSLGVEEQFYIIFPMLLMWRGLQRLTPFIALMLAGSLGFSIWFLTIDAGGAFFVLPSRAWELLVGALAALHLRRLAPPLFAYRTGEAISALGILSILGSMLMYDESTRFPGLGALPVTLGTAAVIVFARDENVIQRLLKQRLLVGVGLISYGLYLWHQPIFALFQQRFGSVLFDKYLAALFVLTFALAFASYRLVEVPCRRRLSGRVIALTLTSSIVVTASAIALINIQATTKPETLPAYQRALQSAPKQLLRYVDRRDVRMSCGERETSGVRQCDFGDPSADAKLVLWGDSLAGALLSGLDEVARRRGVRGVAFIANGCPPVLGLANSSSPTCGPETHSVVLGKIEALKNPTDVIITGNLSAAISAGNITIDGNKTTFDAVYTKLSEAASRLGALGTRTIILEQGPVFPTDVSSYLMQNLGQEGVPPLVVNRARHAASLRATRELADVVDLYVETETFFCTDDFCPSVDEHGTLVIYDKNHITREYASLLAQYLENAVRWGDTGR